MFVILNCYIHIFFYNWSNHHHIIGSTVGIILPTVIGALYNGAEGALGGFLVGGITPLVAVPHCTFLINSLCHTMGSRPYDSKTSARDHWFMAIFTFGEGYHNYHHSFQHDYRNGVKPWQWDPPKWAIWTLEKLGLVSDLRRVSEEKIVLAELREIKNQTEAQIADSQGWNLITCPTCQEAYENLVEMCHQLGEGYHELETAVGDRIKMSGENLAYWRDQPARAAEQLTMMRHLQAGLAACSPGSRRIRPTPVRRGQF